MPETRLAIISIASGRGKL